MEYKLRPTTPTTATWFAFVGFMLYWLLAVFVPAEILQGIFNNLSLGVAILVAATWARPAWSCFRRGADEGEWVLVIAIFLAFCVLIYQRILAIAMVLLGRPDWLHEGPLVGFVPYSITLVGFMFLYAPGIARQAPAGHYWRHLLVACTIGGVLAGFLIGRTLPPL